MCNFYSVTFIHYDFKSITTTFNQYFLFSTAWHNQPYSLGSYTSIGVGGQQNDIERLAEPMFQRPNNRTVRLNFSCYSSSYNMLFEKTSFAINQISLILACFIICRRALSSIILFNCTRSLSHWSIGLPIFSKHSGYKVCPRRGRRRI